MKNILVILAVIVVLGFFGGLAVGNKETPIAPAVLGGMTSYDGLTLTPVDSTDGFKLGRTGTSPSTFTYILGGTLTNTSCTGSLTQPATTTSTYYCSVTNSSNGDIVLVTLSSTTPYGVDLNSAWASTTGSNQIVLKLNNASTSATSATTTGVSFMIFRKL